MSGDPAHPASSSPVPRLFFFFFLLVLPIAVLSVGESGRNDSIPQCYSFRCGDGGVEIGYPLWNSSEANTRYCGYPGLGIECREGNPVLKLGTASYRVADVRYNTSTITLQDMDLLDSRCPRARHNLTLVEGGPLADSNADVGLYFFFNCSGDFDNREGDHKVPCLSGGGSNSSYVFREGTIPQEWYLLGVCQDTVVARVLRTEMPSSVSGLLSSFDAMLRRGFELAWQPSSDMANCKSCERAGGKCEYTYNQHAQVYEFLCSCTDGTYAPSCSSGGTQSRKRKLIIGISVGTSGFLLTCITFYCWCYKKRCSLCLIWTMKSRNSHNVEAFLEQYGTIIPKRYRYAEVKMMTKSFTIKLGQGGYGTVFKGRLPDGRLVAAKVFKSKENIEEFVNEVASIGRTHHVNIVSLLGFCCEGSKRALLYEFMPNGSLEKYIFMRKSRDVTHLGWEKLLEIAIGIARGLEYLHRGCNTRIVHFDIKPHNILLDEDFCPKISDFGLAKSCHPKQSILSTVGARGTIGYIAPEVFSRKFGVVSSKSDVYSYGMMVLEMVGGRANIDARTANSSDIYFPHWIYEHFNDNVVLQLYGITNETEEVARKMILVGLWCIQTSPSSRPSTSKVLEMLEGNFKDLQMPPKPYLSSP